MKKKRPDKKFYRLLSLLTVLVISGAFVAEESVAQPQDTITLDLMLHPRLTKAQVIELSSLGVNSSKSGAPVFNLFIRNNTNQEQTDLYLDVQFLSDKVGSIAEFYQEPGRPFSLRRRQVVAGSNKRLKTGLPGVEEPIIFDGGLTSDGEEFLNSMQGTTQLPADIYTVILSIYQGNNSRNGGILLASVEQSLGENLITDGVIDLYLLQPGGELGSDQSINSKLPVFRWDGLPNRNYRLILVEDNGQSPEALIQSARDTEPVIVRGPGGSASMTGSLLEFEVIDARIRNTTFAMPPSGAKTLELGQRYYWQVFTERQTADGVESLPSEIWEFTISEDGTHATANVSRELRNSLRRILGPERYNRLDEDGYRFFSITIDGQTLEGATAIQKLQELSGRLADGDISIVIN